MIHKTNVAYLQLHIYTIRYKTLKVLYTPHRLDMRSVSHTTDVDNPTRPKLCVECP